MLKSTNLCFTHIAQFNLLLAFMSRFRSAPISDLNLNSLIFFTISLEYLSYILLESETCNWLDGM